MGLPGVGTKWALWRGDGDGPKEGGIRKMDVVGGREVVVGGR